MKKIVIIIPYVRQDKIETAIRAARDNAGLPYKDYEILCKYNEKRVNLPEYFNDIVKNTESEMVCFIGDDCVPHKEWLKNAAETMKRFEGGFGLVGLNDRTGRVKLPTHWLGHRKILEFLGGDFWHDGYWHCCADVELGERCMEQNRYLYDLSAYVEHRHPMLTGQQEKMSEDEIYKRAYSEEYLKHDRELLKKRRKNGWK